ncbi:MAG: 4Fe-4S cluster-binding domain-containing protein [Bacteroidales bacterium]|nr:4Fe-4S cluster-binding domain-containing protein [Bacteroidales bacterium]
MIPTPGLHKANIFNMPVGKYFKANSEEIYLLYSPLADKTLLVRPHELRLMESNLTNALPIPEYLSEALKDLLEYERINGYVCPSRKLNELTKLTILPTYDCNFSCSYCYAQEGRSTKILKKEDAKATIDFFIDPKRLAGRKIFLSVLGGGEPFMAWDICKHVISYARQRANKYNFTLGIGLTTNGSIINKEIIKILQENDVKASVSFEILPHVQNTQREQYKNVCTTIDTLCESGISVTFKSIITPNNVNLLDEMVVEMSTRFPAVKSLKLQPVEDSSMFSNSEELKLFFNQFSDSFFNALKKAEALGLDLYCPTYSNMNYIMEHFCGGEMCLTPEGSISICHRISSPQEKHYKEFVYGHVYNQKMDFDEESFNNLIAHDMHHDEKCLNCFSKWHCGGGCLATAYTYDDDRINEICTFTREFMAKTLLFRLDKFYIQNFRKSLEQIIDEMKDNLDSMYSFYEYCFHKEENFSEGIFKKKIQFEIKARSLNTMEPINYLLNFYEFGVYMQITDIFPAAWENERNCFERLTSKEGVFVNMKKLSVTSLIIFIREFLPLNQNAAMVISGSYEPLEDKKDISRKLKLYKKIFNSMLKNCKLKIIDVLELNAFIILSNESSTNEEKLIKDYYCFKNFKPD